MPTASTKSEVRALTRTSVQKMAQGQLIFISLNLLIGMIANNLLDRWLDFGSETSFWKFFAMFVQILPFLVTPLNLLLKDYRYLCEFAGKGIYIPSNLFTRRIFYRVRIVAGLATLSLMLIILLKPLIVMFIIPGAVIFIGMRIILRSFPKEGNDHVLPVSEAV